MSTRIEGESAIDSGIKFRDRLIRTIHRREKLRKTRKQRRKYRLVVVTQTSCSEYRIIGPWGEQLIYMNEYKQLLDAIVEVSGVALNMFDIDGRRVR